MMILDAFIARFGLVLNNKQDRAKMAGDNDFAISVKVSSDGTAVYYNDHRARIGSGVFTCDKEQTPNNTMQKKIQTANQPTPSPYGTAYQSPIPLIKAPDFAHEYASKKHMPTSLFKVNRAGHDGRLYAEMRLFNEAGKPVITGIEHVDAQGKKGKLTGSKAGFFVFNRHRLKECKQIAICEGLATAWAYNQATGFVALAVGGWAGFMPVLANLDAVKKLVKVTIVTDNDKPSITAAKDAFMRFGASRIDILTLDPNKPTRWDYWDYWSELKGWE